LAQHFPRQNDRNTTDGAGTETATSKLLATRDDDGVRNGSAVNITWHFARLKDEALLVASIIFVALLIAAPLWL